MTTHDATSGRSLDLLTLLSVAIVAYCSANVIHEGLGHGGACMLVGGKPEALNAIFFSCSDESVSEAGRRVVAAGGSVANLLAAALAFGYLATRRSPSWSGYFAWLFGSVNVLQAFGYLLFSGLGGIGDWAVVTANLEPKLLYRAALAICGSVLYFIVAPPWLQRRLEPFLGREPVERKRRTARLTVLPYFVGGVTYVAAGLLNPYGLELVLISAAAASFGGTSLLAWYFTTRTRPPMDTTPSQGPELFASAGWRATAIGVLVVFVGVLGRGVRWR